MQSVWTQTSSNPILSHYWISKSEPNALNSKVMSHLKGYLLLKSESKLNYFQFITHLAVKIDIIWARAQPNQQNDVFPAKTHSLGIQTVCSESLLCTLWVAKVPNLLQADSDDSDQMDRWPDWSLLGSKVILLILSRSSSFEVPLDSSFYSFSQPFLEHDQHP